MLSRPRPRLRFAGTVAGLIGLVGLAVAGPAPARADVPVLSNFDDIVSFAQTAYGAYETVSGQPSDLQQAVSQIAAELNSVRSSLVSEIDNAALAQVSACMNSSLTSFENIQVLTTDSLQSFAASATTCVDLAQGDIAHFSDPPAIDEADAAMNTVGPVALLTLAYANENSDLLKQTLITGNQQLLSKLTPTCGPTILSPSDAPGVGTGPVTGHLGCYNYKAPTPGYVDGKVWYLPPGPNTGFDPWYIRGECFPLDDVIIWGDHGVAWPTDAYVGHGDYSIAINLAMAGTSYPIADAALYQLLTPLASAGSPIAAGVSTVSYAPVEALRVNGDGTVSRNEVHVSDDTFSGWTALDGRVRSLTEATNANGRVEMFAVDKLGVVFHRWQETSDNDASWSPWARMTTAPALTSIAAARNQNGTLQVFGTDPAGALYTSNQIIGTDYAPSVQLSTPVPATDDWTAWKQIGGQALSQVAAGVNSNGQIEVFGLDSAGGVFDSEETALNATDPSVPGTWSGWNHLDGTLTSIAVSSDLSGYLNLMGTDPSGNVLHRYQRATSTELWSAWTTVPGATLSHVAAAMESFGSGHIDLFGSNAAGQIQINTNDGLHGDAWTGWRAIPDAPMTPPAPASPGGQQTTWGAQANVTLSASGGTAPYTYSATGLPPGLVVSGSQLVGTVTAPGAYSVTVTTTDTIGESGTTTFAWNVVGVTVPDIVGLNRITGNGALYPLGLMLGNERDVVEPMCDDTIGQITAQSPAAGSVVPIGTSVNFDFGVKPSGKQVCN